MGKRGLTIVELMAVFLLLSILMVSLSQLYILGLKLWEDGYERQQAGQQMSQAFERVSQYLRQARSIDDFNESSISFSADMGAGLKAYRLYLYNPLDAEPNPPFTQATYELRLADGDIDYGDGVVLSTQIERPTDPGFTRNDDFISLDLMRSYLDSSLRFRSSVQLRNL